MRADGLTKQIPWINLVAQYGCLKRFISYGRKSISLEILLSEPDCSTLLLLNLLTIIFKQKRGETIIDRNRDYLKVQETYEVQNNCLFVCLFLCNNVNVFNVFLLNVSISFFFLNLTDQKNIY